MVRYISNMRMAEHAAQWIAETDRIIGLVLHEFSQLDEKQLHYKVHVSHCSISQLMQHVFSINSHLFFCIERAIPVDRSTIQQVEYHPGYWGKYFIKYSDFKKCIPKRKTEQVAEWQDLSPGMLFSKIIDQQNRIKELVTLCKSLDMNRRVVPFRFFGLIKLSIAETIDYLILHQKSHFRMARHIMMLQQI